MSAPPVDGLDALSDAQVLDECRAIEQARRELDAREALVLAQVRSRGLASTHGCASDEAFLRVLLNIGVREAAARLRLADALAPRRTLTGELVPPAHPQLASALRAGEISARAAGTIIAAVARLDRVLVDGAPETVESVMLDFARENDPERLARHARDVVNALDQDGQYRDLDRQQARRDLRLVRRVDGSGTLSGELTCEAAEYVATLLDSLSKPHLDDHGHPDPRTPGQRRHDALLGGLKLLFQSGRLPKAGGCATTLLLAMDADTFATGHGTAKTGHGVTIPAAVAKSWLDPEARAILVLLSKTKGITAYSSTHRLFTEQQRLAMAARDRGCSYPGCDAPIAWTEAHHVTDYAKTRRTSVDDGALVCSANHSTFERMGWTSITLHGIPHWVPPDWLDPTQKPIKNRMHD